MMPSILLKGKEEIILLQNVPFIRISSVVDPHAVLVRFPNEES